MTGWRFLLSARWAGYLALVVAFAIACSLLGTWQLARRAEAHAAIVKIDENYDSSPAPLATLLPALDSFEDSQEWTQVELRGEYLADDQLLVRTRPLGGNPGFEVLVPLRLEDGSVFVVDRGWVAVGSTQDAPDVVPAAPAGPVTVVARLKPGEPELAGRTAPDGQIATIQLDDIATRLGLPTYTGAYGLMVSESPAPPERPVALPKPPRDEGPHLSYAFQWYVFALLGFIGFGWAIRQEYRLVNADDPEERDRAAERERRRAQRTPTDADVEDAILDRVES
ncbi:SURF1 family protein [Leifsonia bigeumensis]|uniref:SURF1-like protein n=1 Tax=Leifsonella bigeumensis TaxID=433643 RepID=A0ABP7FT07_9MICO